MDGLEGFIKTLQPQDAEILYHVRTFIEWYVGREGDFRPDGGDAAGIRTYLMEMRLNGGGESNQRKAEAALKRYYEWAEKTGMLEGQNPFLANNLTHPHLRHEEAMRREETFSGTPEQREIARISALNQLASQLNRYPDMKTTLEAALKTLVSLLGLKTAWAFLLPAGNSPLTGTTITSESRFFLTASYGLPEELDGNGQEALREAKLCHCQTLALSGRLKRAVNVVECSRLPHAGQNGGSQGLLFHASVPIVGSGQPLGIINVATHDWQLLTAADLQLLSAVGEQVAIALERARLYDETHAQRLRLEGELRLAHEFQKSLLPKNMPEIPGFSLAAAWQAVREMAGDFYDTFRLADGRWGIVIADVSDKGAAAAMYMAMTRSLIRDSAAVYPNPAGVLKEVNRHLLAHSSADMFVTVFYAVLDPETRTLTYANAGHNPPLLRRAGGEVELLTRTGMALGVVGKANITEAATRLGPQEAMFLYTDGITDALNAQNEDYGMHRLTAAVRSAPGANAQEQLKHLISDLNTFTGEVQPFDDVTLFVITKEGEA